MLTEEKQTIMELPVTTVDKSPRRQVKNFILKEPDKFIVREIASAVETTQKFFELFIFKTSKRVQKSKENAIDEY